MAFHRLGGGELRLFIFYQNYFSFSTFWVVSILGEMLHHCQLNLNDEEMFSINTSIHWWNVVNGIVLNLNVVVVDDEACTSVYLLA